MSLIKCPECGKEVSDSANVCPNCGYPVKKMKEKNPEDTKIVGKMCIALSIIFGFIMFTFIYNLKDSHPHFDHYISENLFYDFIPNILLILTIVLFIVGIILLIKSKKK